MPQRLQRKTDTKNDSVHNKLCRNITPALVALAQQQYFTPGYDSVLGPAPASFSIGVES
jgi:hypothetical protein